MNIMWANKAPRSKMRSSAYVNEGRVERLRLGTFLKQGGSCYACLLQAHFTEAPKSEKVKWHFLYWWKKGKTGAWRACHQHACSASLPCRVEWIFRSAGAKAETWLLTRCSMTARQTPSSPLETLEYSPPVWYDILMMSYGSNQWV